MKFGAEMCQRESWRQGEGDRVRKTFPEGTGLKEDRPER